MLIVTVISAIGNETSIAIAPRDQDLPLVQPRDSGNPRVYLVNATSSLVEAVQLEANGSILDLAGKIQPYQTAIAPTPSMRLFQSTEALTLSSFIGHALIVKLASQTGFTVSLNLGTAAEGAKYLTFYLMTRGIFAVTDHGDPRAIGWV